MKLTVENKILSGIPLYECYAEQTAKQELLFINHGFTGSKEGEYYFALELAKLGYFVVALDAAKHGERIAPPFNLDSPAAQLERFEQFFEVVLQTGMDNQRLFKEHYQHFKTVSLLGFSMGAMVTYYTATILKEVQRMITVVGTPTFLDFSKYKLATEGLAENLQTLQKLAQIDPIKHLESFRELEILMLTGKHDTNVPNSGVKELQRLLITSRINPQVEHREYETGHQVTKEMKQAILEWCRQRRVLHE